MNQEKQKMRKTNMRIFPTYKKLAWDYLFFYTIDFLFLTQVKGFSASDVVLQNTFYAFFSIIMQIPANVIVEFLGRKNSIILGNVLNCFYMIIIMLSHNLVDLIFAEFICCTAFAIKEIAEPSLLNESIAPSRYKSKIYAKINAKGASGYYMYGAISKVIAGALYTINPYIPIICSLVVLIIVVILSTAFIEPIQKKGKRTQNTIPVTKQLKDIKQGFTYILKSERLKALILCSAMIVSLLSVLSSYYVSLLEDLEMSSIVITIISAIGGLLSAYASKKQNIIQNKFKNRTLITIAMSLSISTIIAGIFGIKSEDFIWFVIIIAIMQLIYDIGNGVYYTIISEYMTNFANEKIDTKIFATNTLFSGIAQTIVGIFASFLLDKFTTAYCMLIIGIIFTVVYILTGNYMKKRVGLKPEEYSAEERRYDEIKYEKQKI